MTNHAARKVLICDSQPLAIEGLRWLLSKAQGSGQTGEGSEPELVFGGAVENLEAVMDLIRSTAPAAVILDKGLGTSALMDWLHQFAASGLNTSPVVWGSSIAEAEALRLLQAGARGIVRRTAQPQTLLTCLRAVTSGNTWMEDGIFGDPGKLMQPRRSHLTPREQEIATLVERGLRNRDIAKALGIQTGTVKIHLKHIFEKTGVRGRYGLALTGLREKGALTPMTAM